MNMHQLKTLPPFFDAIWDGRKTFEVRRNDRGFQAGDKVWLREWGRFNGRHYDEYTGRSVMATVGYVLSHVPPNGDLGAYVAFSIKDPAFFDDPENTGSYSEPPRSTYVVIP